MLQHHQGHSYFRLTTIQDIKNLAPRLRYEDKREILTNSGMTPYQALFLSYKYSEIMPFIIN